MKGSSGLRNSSPSSRRKDENVSGQVGSAAADARRAGRGRHRGRRGATTTSRTSGPGVDDAANTANGGSEER
eukprot:7067983-Prymnesium_polylepis.1